MCVVTDETRSYWRHLPQCTELMPDFTEHVLEFGVGGGGSTCLLRESVPEHISVFGFDTFTGLPEAWIIGDLLICAKGTFHKEGNHPDIENVFFYTGLFEDTLPKYNLEFTNNIGLLHIDCDLYSSTLTILNNLTNKIVKNTILIFDEWEFEHIGVPVSHEKDAFTLWATEQQRKYEILKEIDSREEVRVLRMLN